MKFKTALAIVAFFTSLADAAVITNGVIKMGVNIAGHLNYDDVGLRYHHDDCSWTESLIHGSDCEGWGVSAKQEHGTTTFSGWVNQCGGGGARNLQNIYQSHGGYDSDYAISHAQTENGWLDIEHDYHPYPYNDHLFEVIVTLRNTGERSLNDL